MSNSKFVEATFDIINKKVGQNFILLVTATQTETRHLHQYLTPFKDSSERYIIYKDQQTYYLATLGKYNVVHVQCSMGSIGRDAVMVTVKDAINDLSPKIVIMIGIAFGIDSKKQNVGDVLVSEIVFPYEPARLGEKGKVNRGGATYANVSLVNRFKNSNNWSYDLPKGKNARILVGSVLSGEKLIDDIAFRDSLVKDYPTAIGGDMEGAGLSAACGDKASWILIKGICDFADGNKKVNKFKKQAIAMEAAIAASRILFDSISIFDGLHIRPFSENSVSVVDLHNLSKTHGSIGIQAPITLINEIVDEFIVNSIKDNTMLKPTQTLVKAFLSLTEVDKNSIARRLNLNTAGSIGMPEHIKDKLLFTEIKEKNLTAELWDEVFHLVKLDNVTINPFKNK